jgi:hypothetical protein
LEEQDRLHLPKQYIDDYYNVIEAFQGKRRINVPIHVRDLQAKGDGIYAPEKEEKEEHFPTQPATRSLMQKLFVEDHILEESQEVPQFNQGINPDSTINLDDFSQSFGPCNPPLRLTFVNLGSDSGFTTPMKGSTNPTHATSTTPGNIRVKRKRSSMFMHIIEASIKTIK